MVKKEACLPLKESKPSVIYNQCLVQYLSTSLSVFNTQAHAHIRTLYCTWETAAMSFVVEVKVGGLGYCGDLGITCKTAVRGGAEQVSGS